VTLLLVVLGETYSSVSRVALPLPGVTVIAREREDPKLHNKTVHKTQQLQILTKFRGFPSHAFNCSLSLLGILCILCVTLMWNKEFAANF